MRNNKVMVVYCSGVGIRVLSPILLKYKINNVLLLHILKVIGIILFVYYYCFILFSTFSDYNIFKMYHVDIKLYT